MLTEDEYTDIEIYLKDEGLSREDIDTFIASHGIKELTYNPAWEIIENHILRDDYDDDPAEV
jgi:hypothetical protein